MAQQQHAAALAIKKREVPSIPARPAHRDQIGAKAARHSHDALMALVLELGPTDVQLRAICERIEALAGDYQELGYRRANLPHAWPHHGMVAAGADPYCLGKELLCTATYARELARALDSEPAMAASQMLYIAATRISGALTRIEAAARTDLTLLGLEGGTA
ncbi:hypothetical protein [Solimonas sp. SE-A11]|uniref:hypothetical protein n=1 Tax=Solimonas sp. SE-A11 TaxID=3054954 RepID=UPI00259C8A4A|nr:hypothetical protein [Solimonas sp. SE-A11]MDM4770846.1 hypothetical protein [Solimonas sp. SE-A11]